MRVRLLGTGGADGIPSLFADSRVSKYARECGGRDVRTRSAALIDDGLKVDLPPDTFSQIVRDKLDAREWTAVLFTHSDDDHIAVNQLQYALFPFTEREILDFTVYGNAAVVDRINRRYEDWPMELVVTRSFEPFTHLGYTVTPFRANHKHDEDSQNLIVQSLGQTLIYATDTGVWDEESWEFLSDFKADALVIECTNGFVPNSYTGHLDLEQCVGVVKRLRKIGVISEGSKVVTTHHSHTGNGTYKELHDALRIHDVEAGWDGIVIDF